MMMLRAQLDSKTPVINFVYKPATYIQNYFSMWRGWSMFAPNPLRMNAYIDAKIIFEDDGHYIFNFLNVSDENLVERYFYGERLRKYMVDGLRLDKNKFLWNDAAKYVLRKIAPTHFKRKPKKVILRRRWSNLPKMNEKFIPHRTKVDKSTFNTYEFYTYKVGL